MIRVALPLLALSPLTLMACTPKAPVEAPTPPASAECRADMVQDLIGKPRSEAVAKDALARSGAKTIRWIPEGSAVTMDYRADRLNLSLDAQGAINKIGCS